MSRAVIIYDTRSGNTGIMARAIEEGMAEAGIEVMSRRTVSATAGDAKDVEAVILGSRAYHSDMMDSMKTFLFEMEKVNLKGKVGAAFGSYGWSGEAPKLVLEVMKNKFEMSVIEPSLVIRYLPDAAGLERCRELGKRIAERLIDTT